MHPTLLLIAATAFASTSLAQYTIPSRTGTITVSAYTPHTPGYTPSWVDTSTFPAFSAPPSSSNSSSSSTKLSHNYNSTSTSTSTHTATVTASSSPASNYTIPSTFSAASSGAVASTSSGPIPIASVNAAGGLNGVAAVGTSLTLAAAGAVFAVFL